MRTNGEYIAEINSRSTYEGDFLADIREKARAEGIPVMLPATSQFLSTIVKLNCPKNILEIGTAVGYSGSLMLKHSHKQSRLTTIEMCDESIAKARKNFKAQNFENRVRIFQGDASEIIPLMSGKFDFIFLDGPKSRYYEYYPYLKNMLVKGGVLVSDNVLFRDLISGEKKAHKRMNTIVFHMREFLDKLTKDDDFQTSVYDVGDGMAISIKVKG